MEGLGTEITQKIKCAIQAKLNELGSYVDDELPDYVMVMVGNKRSKAQMEHDLKLFLGNNTVPFTTWLYQVLEKLQEVTIKNNAKAKKRERTPSLEEDQDFINIKAETDGDLIEEDVAPKRKQAIEKPVKTKVCEKPPEYLPSKIKDKDKRSSEEKTSEKKVEKVNKETNTSVIGKRRISSRDEPTSSIKRITTISTSESVKSSNKDEVYKKSDDGIKRRTSSNSPVKERSGDKVIYDARELLNRKKAEKLTSKDISSSKHNEHCIKRKRDRSPDDTRYTKRAVSSHGDSDNVSHRLSASKDSERDKNGRDVSLKSTIHRTTLKRKTSDDEKSPEERERWKDSDRRTSDTLRSNKVNKVSDSVQAEQEMFKPRNSSKPVGTGSERKSLHSRVVPPSKENSRESERDRDRDKESGMSSIIRVTPRPKRPASQQPSSSLILKAVAEANKSLAAAPARLHPSSNRNLERPLRGKISPDKITITLPNQRVQPIMKDGSVMCNNYSNSDSDKQRLKEDEEKMLEKPGSQISIEKEDMQYSANASCSTNSHVSEKGKEVNEAVNQWLKGIEEASPLKPLPDSFSSQETDLDSEPVLEICQNMSELEPEEEPEFVVTLHGLDPGMFPKVNDNDQDEDYNSNKEDKLAIVDEYDHVEEDDEDNNNNDIGDIHISNNFLADGELITNKSKMLSPQFSSTDTSPDKKRKTSSPIIIVKPNQGQVSAVETVDNVKMKSLERCKYWPSCLVGDKCSFHHPSAMCNAFPACKYGDSCLFIHPPCKFGMSCTRRDCLYTHGASTIPVPKVKVNPLASTMQHCRFFPNCSNLNCQFYHPKPCRFKRFCTKKDCPFDHKVGPTKDKLKWTRVQTT